MRHKEQEGGTDGRNYSDVRSLNRNSKTNLQKAD